MYKHGMPDHSVLKCYTVAVPQTKSRLRRHPHSSCIRIVLLGVKGGLRNVSNPGKTAMGRFVSLFFRGSRRFECLIKWVSTARGELTAGITSAVCR